ncbi:MAG: ATP-binding protein [Atopobiaceae bacterium]|nr:ATP-binding protein [Atopobiaceae bacterium]MBQ3282585.1 ATP-binding protein [Atopobiaceae bacterium]MBQ6651513.1 ATP-binding protein [Atopobiaceae bacterium]
MGAAANAQGYVIHEGCDHIFFVGFLGAGKSTIARNLGRMFHRPYVDTDRLAERICHCDLADVYATQGEEAFRDAETQALHSLIARKSLLVSCGGGIVERPENVELMHQMGVVLFLDGDLDDSLRQIQRTDRRPDLGTRLEAERLYARRRPLYEAASDYSVSITNRTFEEVAQAAGELLWEKGLL